MTTKDDHTPPAPLPLPQPLPPLPVPEGSTGTKPIADTARREIPTVLDLFMTLDEV